MLDMSLVLAKDVQGFDSFQPRLHLKVLTSRGDMSTRTYNPSGHFTSATCIALLDRAPCQAMR